MWVIIIIITAAVIEKCVRKMKSWKNKASKHQSYLVSGGVGLNMAP